MNKEEIRAMNECKILMISLYDYMSIEKSRFYCNQYKIILELIEKQQKEIENYQILKDDIEGHNIVYVDTPEFEENYISKDKIRDIIFEFIPKSNHEAELRTKIVKLLGE